MAQQKSVSEEAAGGSVNAVYAAMHAAKSCKTKRENEKYSIDKAIPTHILISINHAFIQFASMNPTKHLHLHQKTAPVHKVWQFQLFYSIFVTKLVALVTGFFVLLLHPLFL